NNVPESWNYSSAYRDFEAWGYRAGVDAPGAGFVYLEGVHQGGLRVNTRRWAPDGPPMENATIRVTTAPGDAPGQSYKLLDCKLFAASAETRSVRADSEGRIEFSVDGAGHEISVQGPGTGADAPVLLPLTARDRLRVESGREIHLPIRIFNPRMEAM